ncbi:c-5 sterol desaturase [Ophidiomyces ophidiicola]|nr:c-5 sterol desaturase [Ophidiomyces ophidiicola]
MDVVLEVFDSLAFDYLYALALPGLDSAPLVSTQIVDGLNKTVTTKGNGFIYHPASQYLNLEPSKYAYMSSLTRDDPYRQAFSLFIITWIFGVVLYFVFASLSYFLVFDKTTVNHPKYLKNQMRLEIAQTMGALPIMAILTVPFFLAEVRGFGKMYDTFDEAPFKLYNVIQFPFFFMFTDFLIYWIHRGLHHPLIYKRLHKPHHKWIMPTPFASHAFHPVDGWAQSLPYHIFPFIFPLQKFAYVLLFMAINIWTILIHDGEYATNNPVINGAACHTMHHLYFNYNYGQFTTLWDRLGNSYRKPNDELFRRETKMDKSEWNRQVEEMEALVKEVEGDDDRQYLHDEDKKKNM